MRLSYDHLLVMKEVGIAKLKARLSAYLRQVRRGETLVVLDRSTPVARIVPYDAAEDGLSVRPPRGGIRPLGGLPPFETLDLGVDPVDLLLEDRASGR
jgi:prevent-host-death family protein